MNFFGLNSATLNGGVYKVVVGAALVLAGASAAATPTRTTTAAPITVTPVVNAFAKPVRNVLPSAAASATSLASAQWVLATTSSAGVSVSASASATFTDAYTAPTSAASAAGAIIRPGAGASTVLSSGAATALRTAGAGALIDIPGIGLADASVKRAGRSTTDRDGYAVIGMVANTFASGDKITLGEAIGQAYAMAYSDATKMHGGMATISCVAAVTATGANDSAKASSSCDITATGSTLMAGSAFIEAGAQIDLFGSALRPAAAQVTWVQASTAADGRLALRAGAKAGIASQTTAAPRLAFIGESLVNIVAGFVVDPTAIRNAAAGTTFTSRIAATGTRVCMGEGLASTRAVIRADAITNEHVPAPAERTMTVPADARAMTVPYENRAMKVT